MRGSLPEIGWAIFLPPHPVAFVLLCGLLSWSAWRFTRGIAPLHTRVVGMCVWASALVILHAQVLSFARQLHWPGLLVAAALGALVAWRVPAAGASADVAPPPAAPERSE